MYYRGSAAAVIVYDITKQVRFGVFLPVLSPVFGLELELNPATAEFNLSGVHMLQ